MTRFRSLVALTAVAAVAVAPVSFGSTTGGRTRTGATLSGLPSAATGHRPGPDILYARPARAPQLENTGIWHAPPILVSGTDAYRNGEWLYQDYLYDDHGATGTKDPNDPYGPSAHLFSPAAGTFTYPTDKTYANNAADLVEFRVKPLTAATAFRVTLNTLIDPAKSAFTIALGDGSSTAWPFGAGISSPAAHFLTWHGDSATFTDASGKTLAPAPTVRVDTVRRQIQLLVPHATWNPGAAKVRMTIGVGLWDAGAGQYLAPAPGAASATTPGGGTPNGVAIVNVGPRLHEPVPVIAGATIADTAAGGQVLAMFWRERQQSEQLTLGDVSPFAAEVDFGKLARKVTDNSDVPTSGPIDRIFASHYSYGQGVNPANICYAIGGANLGAKCIGAFVGQLQPYALYVPKKPVPSRGFGLTLLLHSLSANYNQYLASHNQSQLGDRGPGSIVLTPAGRGPDGFDAGVAEADTFEAWNDAARHYKLDPDWTDVSGYSMGGFSTYRLLARYPDLFARGFSVVGAPGSVNDQLASLRNTPLLLWNATADELVNLQTSEDAVDADNAAGVHFEEHLFTTADHLTLAANDEYAPGAAFLGTDPVDRDPAHVTYVVDPTEDNASVEVIADHAYWLSEIAPRGNGDATIDVRSEAFGAPDPVQGPLTRGAGALTGGEIPALAYVSQFSTWTPVTTASAHHNVLDITATNVARVVIDVTRAHVNCAATLNVRTDGPLDIVLTGCGSHHYSG
jgi:hypothetical protein